jgi:uncharacterized protein YbjT (DUF2867 family)
MPAAFRTLMLLLAALMAWSGPLRAQESTEPPVPRAAPRGMVSEEVLPRAGGVLVFGGTHGAGLEAVKELVKRGEKVTVMARASSNTAALKALGVNIVAGDALTNDDVVKAFSAAPYRIVVSALGGKDDNFRVDVDGNRLVAAAANSAKIPRMVLVSAIGAGDSAQARPWYLQPFMKEFIAAKTKAEDNLQKSGVVFTIVRFGRLVDKPSSGEVATLSDDHTTFSAIARVDAGRLIADCVKNESSAGKVLTAFDATRASILGIFF